MVHVAIIEDNEMERETLSSFVIAYGEKNNLTIHVDGFSSAEPFLNSNTCAYDIIFMDIELPGMNGMQASYEFRKSNHDSILIFVTNMASFAIKGYEVDAMDFVLKPIRFELFEAKFKKALQKVLSQKEDKITLMVNRSTKIFLLSDILYIEILDHSLSLHTLEGTFETRGSLNKLEEELKDKDFFRCNNYCLVNLKYIKEVSHDEILIGEAKIKISRARKKDFTNRLCSFLGQA